MHGKMGSSRSNHGTKSKRVTCVNSERENVGRTDVLNSERENVGCTNILNSECENVGCSDILNYFIGVRLCI